MVELKGLLRSDEQRAFQRLILLNPAHIVAVYAPFGSRNIGCQVLTVAGIVYEVENGYDEVRHQLLGAVRETQTVGWREKALAKALLAGADDYWQSQPEGIEALKLASEVLRGDA